jgi:signal transduction histidine kinase
MKLSKEQLRNGKDLTVPGLIHDLNNVFQTLVAAADRLSEDPQWSHLSQAILHSVEHGLHLSLSLQSVESPGAPFAVILEDSITFIEDACLMSEGPKILFRKNLTGRIVLRRNWAWERVLINLFLNSVRAMPQGGTISVDARRNGADFSIVVRDTGTGIAPQLLEHIFEPHVSTKSQTFSKALSGLGLHVVETIIRESGGTVQARNRSDGPGAEFLITVPVATAAIPVSRAARA